MTELKHVLSPDANSTKLPTTGHFGTSPADSLPTDRLTVARGYDYFKQQIHLKLVDLLNFEEVLKLSEDKRRSEIRSVLQRLIAAEEGRLAGSNDQERLIQDLLSDVLGLRPKELLRDPTISDILVSNKIITALEQQARDLARSVETMRQQTLAQSNERIGALEQKARDLAWFVETTRQQTLLLSDKKTEVLEQKARDLADFVETLRNQTRLQSETEVEALGQQARDLAVSVETVRKEARLQSETEIAALGQQARDLAVSVETVREQTLLQSNTEVNALKQQARNLALSVEKVRIETLIQSDKVTRKLTCDLTTSQNEVQEGADDRLRLQGENHRLEDRIEIGTRNLTTSQNEVQKGVDNGLRLENQNKILGDEVLGGLQDLREAYIKSLNRLALAAEYRDDQTGQHVQRVSRISGLVAKALGLSDDQVELIRIAASLHDVGKIGIPDAILLKPGKLEPDEFKRMKTHTTIGGKILSGSGSALLQLAETIALTHHECWDGSGYPLGLQGDDIPLAGQIVSIADVWDALTHERPYKKAWSPEESSAEIGRLRGSKFNPRIVKGFQQLFREGLLDKE